MQLVNKNILLISPEPWEHIFVSKHHYATHLAARGNRVFFLNPPSTQNTVVKTDFENVYSVQYTGFIKGLRFLPAFVQRYFIRQKFEQFQDLCRTQFDIVWSFDNSVFFDFSALPKEVYCISHIVDLNQNFEFEKAAKTANICFGVCKPILVKLMKFNRNSHLINHGFKKIEDEVVKLDSLPGKNQIKVFYAGNLDIIYLDWVLIDSLTEKFPEVDFIFAGPWVNEKRKRKFQLKSNFYHVGVLKSHELQSYYQNSDILIICYLSEIYTDQLSNSHKMMEYLGSGKMIIATWTAEYEMLHKDGLILMAKDNMAYFENFKSFIENLEDWNRKEKVDRRRNFALENSYDKQIEKIEQLLLQISLAK